MQQMMERHFARNENEGEQFYKKTEKVAPYQSEKYFQELLAMMVSETTGS